MIASTVGSLVIAAIMLPGLWSVIRETRMKGKASRDFTAALSKAAPDDLRTIELRSRASSGSTMLATLQTLPAVQTALSELPEDEREAALSALNQSSPVGRERYLRRHIDGALAAQQEENQDNFG